MLLVNWFFWGLLNAALIKKCCLGIENKLNAAREIKNYRNSGWALKFLQSAAARWHQRPSWPWNYIFEISRYLSYFSLIKCSNFLTDSTYFTNSKCYFTKNIFVNWYHVYFRAALETCMIWHMAKYVSKNGVGIFWGTIMVAFLKTHCLDYSCTIPYKDTQRILKVTFFLKTNLPTVQELHRQLEIKKGTLECWGILWEISKGVITTGILELMTVNRRCLVLKIYGQIWDDYYLSWKN